MDNQLVIIGGMGPQASLELHRLLINKAEQVVSSAHDFPTITHASLSIRDFITDDSSTSQAIETINRAATNLNLGVATAIGMPCNTAHLLLNKLDFADNPSFISMIDAVCDEVSRRNIKKVGLLATPFTINSKLYETPLRQRGVEVVLPKEQEHPKLAAIIRGVIAGEDHAKLRNELSKIAARQMEQGVEAILLSCTELPIIGVDSSVATISSLDCLANAMLSRHNTEPRV